jgi:transposase
VIDAVFYLLQTACQWRMLPRDYPPRSTVCGFFRAWIATGVWPHVHDVLYRRTRELEGREESPTAAIIDSQSVKTAA